MAVQGQHARKRLSNHVVVVDDENVRHEEDSTWAGGNSATIRAPLSCCLVGSWLDLACALTASEASCRPSIFDPPVNRQSTTA